MGRRNAALVVSIAVAASVAASTSETHATTPPPPTQPTTTAAADTSFLRGEAERQFLEANAGASQVACVAPPADEVGVIFNCYAVAADGTVLAAVATMNDDGGIEFTPLGDAASATTVPAPAPSSGTGNAVVAVAPPTGPSIVTVSHDGSGDFSIQPQNAGATIGAPIAAVTGAVHGSYLVVFTTPVSDFAVTADGAWTFEITPATGAAAFDPSAPTTGADPTVLATGADADQAVTVDAQGPGPVVVTLFTSGGLTPLLEQSGPFTGEITVPAGPGYLGIEAYGPWTLTPANAGPEPASTAVG